MKTLLEKTLKDEETGHNLLGSCIPDPTKLTTPQERADAAFKLADAGLTLIKGEVSESGKKVLESIDTVAEPAWDRFEKSSEAVFETVLAPLGWIKNRFF